MSVTVRCVHSSFTVLQYCIVRLRVSVELAQTCQNYWGKSKYCGKRVVITDESIGVSLLLGARARPALQRLRLCDWCSINRDNYCPVMWSLS